MRKIILGVSVALALSAFGSDLPIQNDTGDENYHLVVAVDNSGLNSYRCQSLYSSNMDKLNFILHKRNIRDMNLNHLSAYVFNENITKIGEIYEKRRGKFKRGVKKLKDNLNDELRVDTTDKSKDVLGMFDHLVNLSLTTKEKIVVVLFSNLRHSTTSKEKLKAMKQIKLPSNLKIISYARSGLECLKGGATSSQIIHSENSYKAFYSSVIIGNFTVETVY